LFQAINGFGYLIGEQIRVREEAESVTLTYRITGCARRLDRALTGCLGFDNGSHPHSDKR
jgi:hypothetical protein